MCSQKRKTRSDKFPLTLHKTGQYCKKVKGKMYYFGKDKQLALERYLEQASLLHNNRSSIIKKKSSDMTIGTLSELYLNQQMLKVQAGEITARHNADQKNCLNKFVNSIGRFVKVRDISTLDLQKYKRLIKKSYSAQRLNLNISVMKAMFHWAKKNEILDFIPNIDIISRENVEHKQRFVFSSVQIKKLLDLADVQMKAMIWLGLNCGFGCTDCSQLKWSDIDFENSRVILARGKTGIMRDLPLWPETIEAIKNVPRKAGNLIFYTKHGRPMISEKHIIMESTEKYSSINMVTTRFSRLIKKAEIKVSKGTGFYSLRRAAATMAARSGDPFAVQRLLGHADLKMATRYVQDVSKQTDLVIENSRKYVCVAKSAIEQAEQPSMTKD